MLCFCFLLVLVVPLTCAGRATLSSAAAGGGGSSSSSSSQKLDVQKHLKNLNRPPVKSIKVEKREFSFFLSPCLAFFLAFSFYLFLFLLLLFSLIVKLLFLIGIWN